MKKIIEKIKNILHPLTYLVELRGKQIAMKDELIDLQVELKRLNKEILWAANTIEIMAGQLLLLRKEFDKTKIHELPEGAKIGDLIDAN